MQPVIFIFIHQMVLVLIQPIQNHTGLLLMGIFKQIIIMGMVVDSLMFLPQKVFGQLRHLKAFTMKTKWVLGLQTWLNHWLFQVV